MLPISGDFVASENRTSDQSSMNKSFTSKCEKRGRQEKKNSKHENSFRLKIFILFMIEETDLKKIKNKMNYSSLNGL